MVGLKNWLKSSRILQFLSKLVLQNNLIAHYCFFKQITEMSICHCLSVKKRVSVKNVKILEMSDFGNTERKTYTTPWYRDSPVRLHEILYWHLFLHEPCQPDCRAVGIVVFHWRAVHLSSAAGNDNDQAFNERLINKEMDLRDVIYLDAGVLCFNFLISV